VQQAAKRTVPPGHEVELGDSPHGNMVRLENVLEGLERKVENYENKLAEYNKNMEDAKAEFVKPFKFADELQEKLKRQFELNALLDLDKKEEIIEDDTMEKNSENDKEQEVEDEECEALAV